MKRNVAIFLFDDVEVLDFAGPFEVFNVASEMVEPSPFDVYTVAWGEGPITARGALSVNPHYTVNNMPQPDILLVPGGFGSRALLKQPDLLNWLVEQRQKVERLLSVCTGSLVFGKAGLLNGLTVATHHTTVDLLRTLAPAAKVVEDQRFVDNGAIITSAGVSAGIDMSLYVVEQLVGPEAVAIVREEMEYGWP